MTSLHDRILRALDAASDTGDVLRAVGDALRASTSLPPRARTFVRDAPDATLVAAARAIIHDLDDAARALSADPLTTTHALLARDHAESARVALARAAIARARPPGAFDPDASLDRAIDALDVALRERCDRAGAEAALGDRVSLRGVDAWLDAFTDRERAVDHTPPEALDAAPPDGVVDAWLRRGAHRRWVEGYAARDPAFAETLDALIELHPADDAVSLAPFAWRRARRRDADAVLRGLRPPARVAAATEPVEVESRTVTLSSVGARGLGARLTCTPTRATLTLYAEPGEVTSLAFGERRVEAPSDANRWVAETPITDDAIALEVVFADGERFAMRLSLPVEAST